MFKPQFAAAIKSGAKCQTVRPTPKRLPIAGEFISLRQWSGKPYRSPQIELRTSVIRKVARVEITMTGVVVDSYAEDCEAFAHADGFDNFFDLRKWFIREHGIPNENQNFEGILIVWH